MQARDIYTIAQLAQRWQCSPDAIYDMVRRGDIKSFRVGKAIRFTAEAVAEYEKGERRTTPHVKYKQTT